MSDESRLLRAQKRASFYIRFIWGKLCKLKCKCSCTSTSMDAVNENTPIASKIQEDKNPGTHQGLFPITE